MRIGHTAAVLLVLVTIGSVFAPATYATHAGGFLSTKGTLVVDSSGRRIILRGVNYPGYQQSHPNLHNSASYRVVADNRFNVVRLPISWANLEPLPGDFNYAYLQFVDRDVQWAKSAGIYVVLDMAQYKWAERFGGEGAPEWTVQDYSSNETGMQQAASDFWSNPGLQEHLIQVWTKVAQHFAHEPAVAGYDLFNEPWFFTSINPELNGTQALDSFYTRTIQAIRAVDPNHIVFVEPGNVRISKLPMTNIVWSPHFYPLSFAAKFYLENYTVLENDLLAKYNMFVVDLGTPMWIGEFGAFMADDSSRATWTQVALDLFNRYGIGWGWWAYDGQYTSIPDQLYIPS